jgi:hypothetical protein
MAAQPAEPAAFPAAELHLPRKCPWYLPAALRARRSAIALTTGAFLLAGCGGGPRQDENERAGNFQLEVVQARFPAKQKLAKRSDLVIEVRNTGSSTAPNVAVTVDGLTTRKKSPDLADPSRPTFVINGRPVKIGGVPESKEAVPAGCDTAYVSTWACGPLKAGASRTFKFSVTAVEAGNYKLSYRVAAGLDGKAKAVGADGKSVAGVFAGKVSDAPPNTRVADDGHTIVTGSR